MSVFPCLAILSPVNIMDSGIADFYAASVVRALGASAMYGYQFHNMQVAAQENGWVPFSTMQCHYNLLYREDEREMIPVCRQYGVSLTPYSPLASGHLARPTWDSESRRSTTDSTMREKYDHDRELDLPVIARVAELAQRRGVPMADIALAWHWARGVTAPIVGCSRPDRVDDAVRALDLSLSAEEVGFLEDPYRPHECIQSSKSRQFALSISHTSLGACPRP